jgi:exopolysaccharide production protein ExoQ
MRYPATLVCILFIFYLFWMDRQKSDRPSKALWVPLVWMFLAGSRYASSWLQLSGSALSVSAYDEGSPVDRAVFFSRIAAGVVILDRIKIDWGRVLSQNNWIWLYFLYCGVSIIWADDSFVSFKRFVKDLGNPIMVLVILTEARPYEAMGVVLRRLAFLLLPLSLLFVRFYPDLGRAYTVDGHAMYTGVGHQKNDLGFMCLVSGIYFSWNLLLNQKEGLKLVAKRSVVDLVFLGMVAYLLHMSQSSTSLACLVVSVSLLLISRTKLMARKPSRIITLLAVIVPLFIVLDATLDVRDVVFGLLGRDATLTNRVSVWGVVKGLEANPIIGAGFMSFWTGDRMATLWSEIGAGINQAHNGYLEQYLNLGYIGVAFIGAILLSGLLKVRRYLNVDYPAAMLRLCFIVTAVLYNYTEASFYGISNMWLLTLFGIIEVAPSVRPESADSRHF